MTTENKTANELPNEVFDGTGRLDLQSCNVFRTILANQARIMRALAILLIDANSKDNIQASQYIIEDAGKITNLVNLLGSGDIRSIDDEDQVFKECDACRAKSGSPSLYGRLHDRMLIEKLRKRLANV